VKAALARQFGRFTRFRIDKHRPSNRAIVAALQSIRPRDAPVRKQRNLRIGQQLDLTDQTIPAAIPARAARTIAIPLTMHSKWIRILERLNGRVQ
jgi:hypothetical protein